MCVLSSFAAVQTTNRIGRVLMTQLCRPQYVARKSCWRFHRSLPPFCC